MPSQKILIPLSPDMLIILTYPDYQTMIPTDWKGLVLRDGLVSNTDVTVSSNSEKSNYYVSQK